MATNADILNTIRSNSSAKYKELIPSANVHNYGEVADALASYPDLYNEFLDAIVNKIVVQRVYDPVNWTFPFKEFMKEIDAYGDAEEILGFDVADGEDYTETSTLTKVTKPKRTNVHYIATVSKKKYPMSFSMDVVKGCIVKEYALTQMVTLMMKRMRFKSDKLWYDQTLTDLATIDISEEIGNPDTDENAKSAFVKVIDIVKQMSIPNEKYNKAGYDMAIPEGELICILNSNASANFDVRVFASLLNSARINETKYFKKIYTANFEDPNTIGFILEGDSYLIIPRIERTTSFFDGSNLITNYWLHMWVRQGINPESQMVKLVGKPQLATPVVSYASGNATWADVPNATKYAVNKNGTITENTTKTVAMAVGDTVKVAALDGDGYGMSNWSEPVTRES